MNTLRSLCAVAVAVALATPAGAVLIPGGKVAAKDCYGQFDVNGVTPSGTATAKCLDNDPGCDQDSAAGVCSFAVSFCVNQEADGCTPPTGGVSTPKFKGPAKKAGLQPPSTLTEAACGNAASLSVKLKKKGKKDGKTKLLSITASAASKKDKDKDKVTLICCHDLAACQGGTSKCVLNAACSNSSGGPDQICLTTGDTGTDLDNGWTGVSHNFPVDPRATLQLCLSGCDASSNPICDANGPVGAGSLNGTTFGPPLPLIAQGVPVCVVNNYQPTPITGKFNVQTGEVLAANPIQVNLFSDVHLTVNNAVCPRCAGSAARNYGDKGKCDSGQNQGADCTVESILTLAQAEGDKTYRVSSSCPPSTSQAAGRLDIRLPLTTGTSTLPGPKPCTGSGGVTVQDDSCGSSGCAATCTGSACATQANGQCIDAKGGISQLCCNNSPSTPCFPTANGGSIVRTGTPDPPKSEAGMAWPDSTYPKTSTGGAMVTTFCEGATTSSLVNITTGLPGPGALILPGTQTLLKR